MITQIVQRFVTLLITTEAKYELFSLLSHLFTLLGNMFIESPGQIRSDCLE